MSGCWRRYSHNEVVPQRAAPQIKKLGGRSWRLGDAFDPARRLMPSSFRTAFVSRLICRWALQPPIVGLLVSGENQSLVIQFLEMLDHARREMVAPVALHAFAIMRGNIFLARGPPAAVVFVGMVA